MGGERDGSTGGVHRDAVDGVDHNRGRRVDASIRCPRNGSEIGDWLFTAHSSQRRLVGCAGNAAVDVLELRIQNQGTPWM